ALDARHVHKTSRTTDQGTSRKGQLGDGLQPTLGNGACAIGHTPAAFEHLGNQGVMLEALELHVGKQVRVLVVEMHHKANRDHVVFEVVHETAATRFGAQWPAHGVGHLALAVVFRHCLVDLWQLSRTDETYSHMPLIPVVSAYLLFAARTRIASVAQSALLPGVLMIGFGVLLFLGGTSLFGTGVHKDILSLNTLAGLIIWLGGVIALFGVRSFREASFPLLFLHVLWNLRSL
ncbi:MAG: archaeosortase/exosortase family protein, partial [Clostridiales bacterium]|nr:archaeosortase/exosortase family protein [Clostridiales bacterium]